MSNIDDLMSQIPISDLASQLGMSEEETTKAVRSALPALLGGLQANAADPAGLAKRIVEGGLSVRQAEALAQQPDATPKARKPPQQPEKDPDTLALEKLLSDVTGLSVAISHREKGGEVRIGYRTLEQLDDLCRRLQQ